MAGPLTDRILDGLPSGMPETGALLRLAEIVETREVQTAAISGFARLRLQLNPDFVNQHAATPGRLLMLLMHEIHHVTLGHTLRGHTPRDNFAFDAVINALLARRFPDAVHTALFTSFYDWKFPQALLRPPPGWRPGGYAFFAPMGRALEGVPVRLRRQVRRVHQALYGGPGATYEDVRAVLGEEAVVGVPLLGDHCGKRGIPVAGSVLRELAGRTSGEWPADAVGEWARGAGGELGEGRIGTPRGPNNRARLRRLIERIAGWRAGGALRTVAEEQEIVAPLPSPDRRSIVLRALGAEPVLRLRPFAAPSRVHRGPLVHLYLDVSGSMGRLLQPLYRAALDCEPLLHPRIHLFSTEVADVSFGALRAGRVRSTGGTDIACVAEHMRRSRVGRACLITDGFVGEPGKEDRRTLEQVVLGVAQFESDAYWDELADVTDHRALLRSAE